MNTANTQKYVIDTSIFVSSLLKKQIKKYPHLKNKSGIYSIVNLKTNKYYIGSTYDLARRWYRHITDLKKNRHKNIVFQSSFNKWGATNFEFRIHDFIEKNRLLKEEQKWLDIYFGKNCYNICERAGNWANNKHTKETKRKISLNNPNRRAVECWSVEGKFIEKFETITQASKKYSISIPRIHRACKKTNALCGKYQWKFGDSNKIIKPYKDKNGGKRAVYQFTLQGVYIKKYKSITQASQYTNNSVSNISHCCNGKIKSSGGYIWSFNEILDTVPKYRNTKQIAQFDLHTGELCNIYNSAKEAAKEHNVAATNITACCRNRQKSVKGFVWKYYT